MQQYDPPPPYEEKPLRSPVTNEEVEVTKNVFIKKLNCWCITIIVFVSVMSGLYLFDGKNDLLAISFLAVLSIFIAGSCYARVIKPVTN